MSRKQLKIGTYSCEMKIEEGIPKRESRL